MYLQVNDFIFISDSAYTREQILAMEKGILNKLQWNLTVPTAYVFIMRYLKAGASADNKSDKEVKSHGFCLFLFTIGLYFIAKQQV